MSPPQFVMDIIEFLYDYKQLYVLFFIHLLLVGLLGTYIIYLLWIKSRLITLETNPKTQPSKCHDHMKYVDYLNEKKRITQNQVCKLQNSKDYRKFLQEKSDPNSRYNKQIDVEEIVFSDQEDEMQKAREGRKNKTM